MVLLWCWFMKFDELAILWTRFNSSLSSIFLIIDLWSDNIMIFGLCMYLCCFGRWNITNIENGLLICALIKQQQQQTDTLLCQIELSALELSAVWFRIYSFLQIYFRDVIYTKNRNSVWLYIFAPKFWRTFLWGVHWCI